MTSTRQNNAQAAESFQDKAELVSMMNVGYSEVPWHLSAAAPDLYAALLAAKEAVFFIANPDLIDQINAALAKADGGAA
jgi:hypothetical protein